MKLDKVLAAAVRGGASDVILKTGSVPRFRFNGDLISLSGGDPISPKLIEEWIRQLVPGHLTSKLKEIHDLDFSYDTPDGARFRVNLFRQSQNFGLVLRVVNSHIKTMDELQLPDVVHTFPEMQRGLILVTGATGSGKSTTLAAIIEEINRNRADHIITIEDPIEYVYKEQKSTINQREIGLDTPSFSAALRSALRQNPDVILVGELRDRETTETALMAAETGHLVLSTLHTMDAVESLTRLLSYFPPHQHDSLKIMLAQTLNAIVSQRLIPRADQQGGLVPAMEIMIANELVKEEILQGDDFRVLKDTIKNTNKTYGMQSFDQSLFHLLQKKVITQDVALAHASNRKDLQLLLQGFSRN